MSPVRHRSQLYRIIQAGRNSGGDTHSTRGRPPGKGHGIACPGPNAKTWPPERAAAAIAAAAELPNPPTPAGAPYTTATPARDFVIEDPDFTHYASESEKSIPVEAESHCWRAESLLHSTSKFGLRAVA